MACGPHGHKALKSSLCGHSLYLLKKSLLIWARSLEEATPVAAGPRAAARGSDRSGTAPRSLSSPFPGLLEAPVFDVSARNLRALTPQVRSLDQRHRLFCLLEAQNLGVPPGSTESESEFQQDPQVIVTYTDAALEHSCEGGKTHQGVCLARTPDPGSWGFCHMTRATEGTSRACSECQCSQGSQTGWCLELLHLPSMVMGQEPGRSGR